MHLDLFFTNIGLFHDFLKIRLIINIKQAFAVVIILFTFGQVIMFLALPITSLTGKTLITASSMIQACSHLS